ncbi:hypothetical protein CgunFtcFv8_010077 [Champsocephalus gunnari]|uniref:Uncharacterized protein n=1 Tax=Champsocephalus gunnari TaxID=52237 RepID=A0AAN8E026_CHAGU|nr:hypothetical protein CgunFtcFv8_010077 [Champsocephalus gunnari]
MSKKIYNGLLRAPQRPPLSAVTLPAETSCLRGAEPPRALSGSLLTANHRDDPLEEPGKRQGSGRSAPEVPPSAGANQS